MPMNLKHTLRRTSHGLRLLVISLSTAALAAQCIATTWSLLAFARWPNVSVGAVGGDQGDYTDAALIRARGGVLVDSVIPGSPAATAGLLRGDLIVRVDGTELREHPGAYYSAGSRGRPGDTLAIEWARAGAHYDGRLKLQSPEPQAEIWLRLGHRRMVQVPPATYSWLVVGPFLLF